MSGEAIQVLRTWIADYDQFSYVPLSDAIDKVEARIEELEAAIDEYVATPRTHAPIVTDAIRPIAWCRVCWSRWPCAEAKGDQS